MSADCLETLKVIDACVRGAAFQSTCDGFFALHSAEFKDATLGGENKLGWTDLHNQYQVIVEKELSVVVTDEKMEALCEVLVDLMKNEEAMEPYAEAVMLLTGFSDFINFKQSMISRAQKTQDTAFGNLSEIEGQLHMGKMSSDGMEEINKLFTNLEETYKMFDSDGWKDKIKGDRFSFSVLKNQKDKGTGKKVNYAKQVMLIDLPVKDQVSVWCEYGDRRNKWDTGIFVKDSKVLHDFNEGKTSEEYNVLAQGSLVSVPKLMRWSMGIPDPFVFRIATKKLDSDGTTAYVWIPWDTKEDCPLKKMDMQEAGICKPHPQNPNQSLTISIMRMSTWTPVWLYGKISEKFAMGNIPAMEKAYKANMTA